MRIPKRESVTTLGLILENRFYSYWAVPLLSVIPDSLAYRLASAHGRFRAILNVPLRRHVEWCIKEVFGQELNREECSKASVDYFRLRSCEKLDLLKLRGDGHEFAKLIWPHGLEHLDKALDLGKGAILCVAHYGSYRACASVLEAFGYRVSTVGRVPEEGGYFDRAFSRTRTQRHPRRPVIHPKPRNLDAGVEIARSLASNYLVSIAIDADLRPTDRARAITVDFLGKKCHFLPGAVTIARMLGVPVMVAYMFRTSDWRHQVLSVSPAIAMEGDPDDAYRRCLTVVENMIRMSPSHWYLWKARKLKVMGLIPEMAVAPRS